MVVWDGIDLVSAPRRRIYRVTGNISYEGVVHEHPRFKIPVEASQVDQNGSVGGRATITNTETGNSMYIFGINHWNWDGRALYVYPVYSASQYNDSVKAKADKIVYPGANIVVEIQ